MNACFITGTDTGIGKTIVAVALIRAMRAQGIAAVGMKPIASGSVATPAGLRNEDALALMAAAAAPEPYEDVNPYCFAPPISPHLAARAAGVAIDLERIRRPFERLRSSYEFVVVEGAGGWLAPIDDAGRTMAELAAALCLPVVLVVGVRLGCLNHAALTLEAMRSRHAPFAGWVANTVDRDVAYAQENIATLTALAGRAPLAVLPFAPAADLLLADAARVLAHGREPSPRCSHGGHRENL